MMGHFSSTLARASDATWSMAAAVIRRYKESLFGFYFGGRGIRLHKKHSRRPFVNYKTV